MILAGRPTNFKKEYIKQAYQLSLLGATDKEMADIFGVSEVTLNSWKKKHPAFLKSLKEGKTPSDGKVAASLYKRACGFEKRQVKIFQFQGTTIEHEYDEYYPPDTAAAFIWLKNRQPDKWRDRKEQVLDVEDLNDITKAFADQIRKADTG